MKKKSAPTADRHTQPALPFQEKTTKLLSAPTGGIRETLTGLGIDWEEQEKILEAIHRSSY